MSLYDCCVDFFVGLVCKCLVYELCWEGVILEIGVVFELLIDDMFEWYEEVYFGCFVRFFLFYYDELFGEFV